MSSESNEISRRPRLHRGSRRPGGISPSAPSRSAAVNPSAREASTREAPAPAETAPAPEHDADSTPRGDADWTPRPSGLEIGHRVKGVPILPRAAAPKPVPEGAKPSHPSLYFNAELSWLDFNWRVLYQAMDERTPLLERLRFLAITENNLDEFVMKQVGGLKRVLGAGVVKPSLDGRGPAEQLDLVREGVRTMRARLAEVWEDDLRPRLAAELDIAVRDFGDLNEEEREHVHRVFADRIYPVLTPLAVDPGHPFPFLSNMSLSLALMLEHPERRTRHFARVKIPTALRWVELPESGHVVPVEQVVRHFAGELFRGMKIESASLFRVTRNADVARDEEVADDLLQMISEELRERRFARVVRLEVEPGMPDDVRQFLVRQLELDEDDLYEIPGLLEMSGFWQIAAEGPWEHRHEPWEPMIPPRLIREGETEDRPDIFTVIRAGDVMVHHPFESFAATVQRFIEEAAADPAVVAIKQTLYRTAEHSRIIAALVRAAEAGKAVAVLVEVTARFDEADNMEWASVLEEAGVNVTYGLVGLKTHAKVALVVREEGDEIRTYCHIGTGNYNSETAQIYADIGILTARPEIGRDAVNLFHYLTGYAPDQQYEELVVAPRDLRRALTARIEREISHVEAGRKGRMIMKMNGLDDPKVIRALYAASAAGVKIDLIVRGQCRLRPEIPGFSENIRVRSIVGRFLEHDRIFWWENDGKPEVWIGSADWRRRNLDDRVEVMLPVRDKRIRKRLRKTLRFALRDNQRAWELQPTGEYVLCERAPGERRIDYQNRMLKAVRKRRRKVDDHWSASG
ncbi:polyphosphate kinase 1 [Candidatus Palauibacter soopunensis]|uniref:polyphosphate kinase 1 n=1 Tax=Candidatus Palauibacter soopunensis TaxID=3056739 RepID=UPI00238F5E1F|nr:polyphosphate kinase 1 [Candidatus Palauibacter soopunensis]MDE2879626.1 polyphosphate kinase 1 [Candidatus Palauibacter soopunensis]